MAKKLESASVEIDKIVQDVARNLGLAESIEIKTLVTTKSKEVVSVSKATAITEGVSEKENLVVVIVYEKAFERVDDKVKYEWVRIALEPVAYDFEKDKIITSSPMIKIPLSYYNAKGDDATKCMALALLTIQQIEDEEKAHDLITKNFKSRRKK